MGLSGGAVVTSDGKLAGIIVTTSEPRVQAGRDLHLQSPSHTSTEDFSEAKRGNNFPDLIKRRLGRSRRVQSGSLTDLTKPLIDMLKRASN